MYKKHIRENTLHEKALQLCIALIQQSSAGNDIAKNMDLAEQACREAKALGADIALFPECWSVGYTSRRGLLYDPVKLWCGPDHGPAADPLEGGWDGLAIASDGPEMQRMEALAAELDMAMVFTFLEEWPGGPRNSAALIDRHGQVALIYAKVHTCAFGSHEYGMTPGDAFPVASIDTACGPVRVGVMICYDREFPESARMLMLNGAEIILVPNACDLEDNRLMQFRTRATENMVGAAMANYPGPDWGRSAAFDGIAFNEGSRDTTIVIAGEEPEIVMARFDLGILRDYRQRAPWGGAFRRPRLYTRITDSTVEAPFIRANASGAFWDA
jgi:N-carbamoylputrescine amidase